MNKIKLVKKLPISRWREFKKIKLHALKLHPQAFGLSYNTEVKKPDTYWRNLLKGEKIFFVEVDGVLVSTGMIKFAKENKFAHIAKISLVYVNPAFRGQGIGKLIFSTCITEAFKNKRIEKIKLIVNRDQKRAISLYKECGFKVVADLKREFKIKDKFFDAYLMELFRSEYKKTV